VVKLCSRDRYSRSDTIEHAGLRQTICSRIKVALKVSSDLIVLITESVRMMF
jgi:hypothetical protein